MIVSNICTKSVKKIHIVEFIQIRSFFYNLSSNGDTKLISRPFAFRDSFKITCFHGISK